MKFVSRIHFCKDHNHVFVMDTGCICRVGKICSYGDPEDFIFKLATSRLLIISLASLSTLIAALIIYKLYDTERIIMRVMLSLGVFKHQKATPHL
jgi:hypothetical protein